MTEHILFSTDGTESSKKVEAQVLDMAKKHGARVTILHVCELAFSDYESTYIYLTELEEHLLSKGTVQLKAVEARFADSGVPFRGIIEKGKPAEVILKVAEEQACDLIVMGSRQINPVQRIFLGSVSNYVVNHSQIPVLIVPSHLPTA